MTLPEMTVNALTEPFMAKVASTDRIKLSSRRPETLFVKYSYDLDNFKNN
jgi:hypothetical protein